MSLDPHSSKACSTLFIGAAGPRGEQNRIIYWGGRVTFTLERGVLFKDELGQVGQGLYVRRILSKDRVQELATLVSGVVNFDPEAVHGLTSPIGSWAAPGQICSLIFAFQLWTSVRSVNLIRRFEGSVEVPDVGPTPCNSIEGTFYKPIYGIFFITSTGQLVINQFYPPQPKRWRGREPNLTRALVNKYFSGEPNLKLHTTLKGGVSHSFPLMATQ
jgi:hypothetical protein